MSKYMTAAERVRAFKLGLPPYDGGVSRVEPKPRAPAQSRVEARERTKKIERAAYRLTVVYGAAPSTRAGKAVAEARSWMRCEMSAYRAITAAERKHGVSVDELIAAMDEMRGAPGRKKEVVV